MKTLFLLLIIYSLQYVAHSHDTSIIYKTYPKKVHPDSDHHKLVNAGSYFKKSYKSKSFTRFQPPLIQEWAGKQNNPKAVAPPDSLILPLDFPGDIKSRVKKVPYFNDKDLKRSKRAANESKPEVKPNESNATATQKPETPKPQETKQTVAAAPKNATISRRSASKNVKPAAKSATKGPKPLKANPNYAKAARSRSVKRRGVRKNANPKRALRKRKSTYRISRAGKPQAKNVKGGKKPGKLAGRQGGKRAKKQPGKPGGKQPSKPIGRQASKPVARPASKPVARPDSNPVGKPASKPVARSASKPVARPASNPVGKPASKPVGRQASKQSKPVAKKPVKPLGRRAQTKANPKARRRASRRLISARDGRPEDYPYMVSIQKDNAHWCSGAILNPQLIISTANCFWKSKAVSRMKVRAGSRIIDTGGQIAYIAEVRKHPGWDIRKEPQNDIALALLDRKLRFSDAVHGVDLPNIYMKPPFDDAWVTSYGSERRDGVFSRLRLTLQVTHMRLMSDEKCFNITSRFGVMLDDSFFCLEQVGRRAPCTRDTGAPAVSDGVLWGLASWGIRKLCGTERFPAMFSDVSEMTNMDFIVNATADMLGEERRNPYLDRLPEMRAAAALDVVQLPNRKPFQA